MNRKGGDGARRKQNREHAAGGVNKVHGDGWETTPRRPRVKCSARRQAKCEPKEANFNYPDLTGATTVIVALKTCGVALMNIEQAGASAIIRAEVCNLGWQDYLAQTAALI